MTLNCSSTNLVVKDLGLYWTAIVIPNASCVGNAWTIIINVMGSLALSEVR